MALYAEHQDAALLTFPNGLFGVDLDLLASFNPFSPTSLTMTVAIEPERRQMVSVHLALTLKGMQGSVSASMTTLRANRFGPTDMFDTVQGNATVDGGVLNLVVSPFSVVHVLV